MVVLISLYSQLQKIFVFPESLLGLEIHNAIIKNRNGFNILRGKKTSVPSMKHVGRVDFVNSKAVRTPLVLA